MPTNKDSSGVSGRCIFKTFLKEYVDKVGLPAPIYENEASSDSSFRSTVVVNNARYHSLPGFSNRKSAEQSASEVALMEIAKSNRPNKCAPLPYYESKTLVQEYAAKMKYAAPVYECREESVKGRKGTFFAVTVEIGGMKYVGPAAETKEEAEMKATRTALLTLQSCSSEISGLLGRNYELTYLPGQNKRKRRQTISKNNVAGLFRLFSSNGSAI